MDNIQDSLNRLQLLELANDYKSIKELLSDSILQKLNNANYYYERGLCNYHLLEYDAALKDFDKAIEMNQKYHQAYSDRGLVYFMLKRYDEALENYDNSLLNDKEYSVAWYNKGLLYQLGFKDDEKAIENYTRALATYQASSSVDIRAVAYNNRGNIYMANKEYDKAIADFDNALKLNPELGVTYLNRGIIALRKLDYNKAKKEFVQAREILVKNEEDNKTFLNFLEGQIKLCDEIMAEAEELSLSGASDKHKTEFTDIEMKIDKIIDSISTDAKSDAKAVVHYTKLFVADIYVKALTAKMNYSNAIYMNDPNEGRVLLNYLGDKEIKSAFENGEKLSELSVYLGSFLPAKDEGSEHGFDDELVMWRTYGRDENGNEARGCSIIIDSKFFEPPVSTGMQVSGDNADMLCRVIYIKDRGKEKRLFPGHEPVIEAALAEFKEQLLKLIELKSTYDPMHAFYNMIDKMVFKKYSKIAYLFKSADYEYEHEIRVIKYVPRRSDTIKCYPVEDRGKPGKLYVESVNPVLSFIQKIYLGPKVHDSAHWSLYLDYQVKQRQNEYKINKMNENKLNPEGVNIVKSKSEFV